MESEFCRQHFRKFGRFRGNKAASAAAAPAAAAAAAAATAAAAAAALGGAHNTYPTSLGSAAVYVQLTFPGLTSAWFCESCAALSDLDGAFLSEGSRRHCVHDSMGSEQTCGDKEHFAAARCVLQGLLPKRILAEAGATDPAVGVYEVADTAAGHAVLGLRVSVSTPAAAAAVAKALKRYQANGAFVAVPAACVADAGAGGRAMVAPDARPTVSARQAGPAYLRQRSSLRHS
jgi:hypothetical protein